MTYTLKRRGLTQVDLQRARQAAGDVHGAAAGRRGRRRDRARRRRHLPRRARVRADGLQGHLGRSTRSGLDDYLQGVVPAESPASWPAEALKAQAIAARTYAITTAKSADFDHYADTRSQVYKGVGIETASTNAAVAATRGQIVTYNGQPVVTYFFSTSGGKTEDVENTTLGNEPKPWLKSVEDEFDSVSPRHRWTTKLTMARAGAQARRRSCRAPSRASA